MEYYDTSCKNCGFDYECHDILTERCPGFIDEPEDLEQLDDMSEEERKTFWSVRGTFFEMLGIINT